ncbi:M23 family metallopeptidase [Solicola gregarius]|uniref:M23 family metallopeptidase n=1 Tax=Solicola gregarius TaxID=2908642 RepID=A0AA46TIN7_9ACTN|nr:M23 family metallopeptidase [Solicola gregarius]UYM05853.1 M23 family metallopeptidase [Solicola gregarius]
MRQLLAIAAAGLVLAGCAADTEPSGDARPGPPTSARAPEESSEMTSTSAAAPAASRPSKPACKVGPAHTSDGTPRFWTKDKRCFRSPWFAKAHRVMIYFGCTKAPYYPHDPSCPGRQGIHHGVDIDMPLGTVVRSNVRGRIVKGTVGSAYGSRAFIVRTRKHDFLIGHVRKALLRDGARVRKGQRIALSGKRGAPDGPHLHFEVRPRGGSYLQALPPQRFIDFRVKH